MHRTLWAILLIAGVVACGDRSRDSESRGAVQAGSPAASPAAATALGTGSVYQGESFTLDLPPGSTIARGGSTDTVRGPEVTEAGRSAEMAGPGPHPTFALLVTVHANAARVPLVAWVDSVRRERAKAAEDFADPGPIEEDTVGVEPAVGMDAFCGDCDARELYVGRGDHVIAFQYEKGIHLAGTREQQEAAHRGVLRTFRWTP
jgi:hypothetical protein